MFNPTAYLASLALHVRRFAAHTDPVAAKTRMTPHYPPPPERQKDD